MGNKSVIICTQELYADRAIYISEKIDLNLIAFCSNPVIYSYKIKDTGREYLAKVKAVLNCTIFVPNTTSLEESQFYL